MVRFGIHFNDYVPPLEMIRLGGLAEKLGIDSLWVSDDGPVPIVGDTFIGLTTLALNTKKVILGTNIVTPFTRHPSMLARAALAIDRMVGGRLILGIAPGGPSVLRRMGLPVWNKPLVTVEQSVKVMRKLFAGERIENYRGATFQVVDTGFEGEGRRIPIHIGARLPKLLKLAGKIGDGVMLTAPPENVARELKHVKEGLRDRDRGLPKAFTVCNYIPLSVSEDRDAALRAAKQNVAEMVAVEPEELVISLGVGKGVREKVRMAYFKGDYKAAVKPMTEEIINAFAIAGTPDECAEVCHRLAKVGVDIVIFAPPLGPNRTEAVKLLGGKVLPAAKSRS